MKVLNTLIDLVTMSFGVATAQPIHEVSLTPQFVDHFTDCANFKSVYFTELSKYRKVKPLFEVDKREDRIFHDDKNFMHEVNAGVNYRTAKSKGIILVSQEW